MKNEQLLFLPIEGKRETKTSRVWLARGNDSKNENKCGAINICSVIHG